ncbi:hypothetical protein NO559_14785 [Dasania sp. GY-MA-18]|uniref:Uncharacterized protein n=1 Tax=Dasania phycosphaerae TaxID=2950436 RepID=A0A9J6RQ39_9GAMM|nr:MULTISPECIES: hypothetical protein [Dasania]MCR8924047.1 hypothetical protein [Dasania sp. GY-MA-18]MCZ0866620.1 hypothetical protein [Dasania phycosphaerae]MCZ0870205.1 hypothetical protein [Dasania phycosphaerae]
MVDENSNPLGLDASIAAEIGKVQQLNLQLLAQQFNELWGHGRNIILCWCAVEAGIEVLVVPHYFLSDFTESLNDCSPVDRLDALNGRFIRQLISGGRQLSVEDLHGTAKRFDLEIQTLELPVPVTKKLAVCKAIDQLVQRYSLNYVKNRGVLLFDICDFSRATSFEQISQLSSLSYSLNSARVKLLSTGVEVNFSRTTTGDGYYIWNQDTKPQGNADLFYFMLLVLADNALARRKMQQKNKGRRVNANNVPLLRTGFHIGSHYEFYQTESGNGAVDSFIVGDVTIELARMLELAQPGQIFIGDIDTWLPTSRSEGAYLVTVDSQNFVDRVSRRTSPLNGLELSGEKISDIHCYLTGETGASAGRSVRRFKVTDKHGYSRNVYNLRINIRTCDGRPLLLGLSDSNLPKRQYDGVTAIADSERVLKRLSPSIAVADD